MLASAHREQGLRKEVGQHPEPCHRRSSFSQAGNGKLWKCGQKDGFCQVCFSQVTGVPLGRQLVVDQVVEKVRAEV